jgi:hypothetical protein
MGKDVTRREIAERCAVVRQFRHRNWGIRGRLPNLDGPELPEQLFSFEHAYHDPFKGRE